MTVGELRRFILGSADNRVVDVIIQGLGIQSQVSLLNPGGNLQIIVRVSGQMPQAQTEPDAA